MGPTKAAPEQDHASSTACLQRNVTAATCQRCHSRAIPDPQRESLKNVHANSTSGHPASQRGLSCSHVTPPRLSHARSCLGLASTGWSQGRPWGRVSCCPQGMFPILEQQVNITSQRSANLGCKTASETQIQPSHTYCLLFKLSSQNPGMEVLPKGGYSTCKSCPLDPKRLSIQTTFHTTPMQHAFLSRKLPNGSY